MPMKPPRPLASSPTSSGVRNNLTTSQLNKNVFTNDFHFTCIELSLVDVAAGLDIEIKSGRPVSSPVCFLRGFLHKSKRSVVGERKQGSG